MFPERSEAEILSVTLHMLLPSATLRAQHKG